MEIFSVKTFEDLNSIAQEFTPRLRGGDCLCLEGELGAGKTTLTQAIALRLGIARVTSPTFAIMREYPVKNHPTIHRLYHLDFYRLSSSDETKSFDLSEVISNKHGLVIIEWPDRLKTLPSKRFDVTIKLLTDTTRQITIHKV